MYSWKHFTLILSVSFAATLGAGMAVPSPVAAQEETMLPAPADAPMAAQTVEQPLVFPKITPPGQPIEPVVPAAGAVVPTALDDGESPAPAMPVTKPFAAPEPQQAGGPKSPTDKIVDHFMTLDTDDSKSVSVQEYLVMVQSRVEARFKAMDANGDGEIGEDEYREFWKSRMARWYRLQR